MKNTMADLNNYLFEQLERLNDEDLTDDQLERELRRADGVSKISAQIIQGGALMLRAMAFTEEYGYKGAGGQQQIPALLDGTIHE